jgi:hypothetical protein
MSSLEIEEKRQTPRHRMGWFATIKLGVGIAPSLCFVTNISAEGVRIHVNGIEVIDDFVLIFPEGAAAQSGTYEVVWRSGADVGAKFVAPITQNV